MCILAIITRYCQRFPLIVIGNRDEELARATGTLALDPSTGLVWAVDWRAGGSWMGIEPRSGRFAILTNCRRPPAAPLTCCAEARKDDQCGDGVRHKPAQRADLSTAATMWRGAAPLSHILAHTTVVPVPALSAVPATAKTATEDSPHPPRSEKRQMVTLAYNPPTSRGTLIRDFLLTGILPGDAGASLGNNALAAALPAVLRAPPYYAGFNLLSCDDLRRGGDACEDGKVDVGTPKHERRHLGSANATAPAILYTTNRYFAEHRRPVTPGQVHCLQNSYLDNIHGEPITARLGQLFTDALHRVIDPIAAEKHSSSTAAIAPAVVAEVATALADECLCDRCHFDLLKMEETAFSATEAATIHAQLHSNNPLMGFTDNELHAYVEKGTVGGGGGDASAHLCDGGAAMREAYLQSSIFKPPFCGYGTRVQSMVLVERVAAAPETFTNATPRAGTTTVIHFYQREVSFDAITQRVVAAPWIAYRILQDGSCVLDSAKPSAL
ncbi:putative Transport and Golgi organization 2 [Leishmania shawi]|uniref:Transport and Golgi organization 2 n=2 Tax=Viannia TaxID=37616 RepID=A0AAW3C4K1_9TRYP